MKRILTVILCLALLMIPVSADNTQAQITSYDAVCMVSSTGSCDVTAILSVEFPENATSFLLPLPADAERISTPGLTATQTSAEDGLLLIVEKPEGFTPSDLITVTYHLPQLVESWDNKQTLTLPLLFGDWNCKIGFYRMCLNLPAAFDAKPLIVDADGDSIKNFLNASVDGSQLTLESGGRSFSPKTSMLELVFTDGFFSLPGVNPSENTSGVTQITSIDAACTVLNDSSCSVSMTAEFAFQNNPTKLRIPVPRSAYDISVSGMRFSKKNEAECKVLVLSNPSGFSGIQTFHISYNLLTTAMEQNGKQQFSLPLLYPQWDYSIRSFSLCVTMPFDFEGLPSFISSYYNDQIDNYLDIQTDGATLLTKSLQPLMDQESLTVQLTLPEHYFDLRFQQGRFSAAETILFWIAAALCVLYWFFFLRIRLQQIVPEARAPLGCNAGQIPYLLQLKPPSFGLMTVTWASIGYLSMERTKARRQMLYRRIDMRNERSRCEAQLFAALFSHQSECRAGGPRFQTAASHCDELTKADWQSRLRLRRRVLGGALPLKVLGLTASAFTSLLVFDSLMTPQSFRWLLILPLAIVCTVGATLLQQVAGLHFARHPQKRRIVAYAILLGLLVFGAAAGCFGTVLLNCILQLLIGLVLLPGTRRSSGGVSLFYQLLGLRKYLRELDVSALETLLAHDAQYYYRTLPYAEALGIGARFTKKFTGFRLEPCHWLNWKGQTIDSAEEFYRRFSLLLDEMEGSTEKTDFLLRLKKLL